MSNNQNIKNQPDRNQINSMGGGQQSKSINDLNSGEFLGNQPRMSERNMPENGNLDINMN